jgi:hypothetical protein
MAFYRKTPKLNMSDDILRIVLTLIPHVVSSGKAEDPQLS